ncbi:MAG: selenocysteine-specific translation elongation factor [Planctomycetia bacterium]|nr:selenocysteine-specific translation elongation factor [Planctomycetia bacterium]
MTIDLILGTAGHIDHGKTSLVRALTGIDTDRLPEEKRRGITIELGFAHLDLGDVRLGIVDVPGHERFVRNMLVGATSIDLAILVVAADDSVKQQTREHLEILRLLRLKHGLIALTKVDLAEADWIDLVEEEIRGLVAGTFLETAPIIRTSTQTEQGIEELKQALHTAALAAAEDRRGLDGAPFRMAIDRTFTIAGHGTVVTGSVTSGAARVGDELAIEPGHVAVRVRGIQNHDQAVESVHRGQRAAINLAGVHHDQIGRGQELASPGHLVPSRLLTVQMHLLPTSPRPLKSRSRVRLHVGTADIPCSVALVDRAELLPGDTAPIQLFLRDAAVTTWGQAFVLREESPAVTIGGGQVIDPQAERVRRRDAGRIARLADLASPEPATRAAAALYFAGLRGFEPADLPRTAGVADVQAATAELSKRNELVELSISPTRKLRVSRQALDEACARLEDVLERMHRQNPLQVMLDVSKFAHRVAYLGSDALVEVLIDRMQKAGRIARVGQGISLAGHGPQLSKNEQKLVEEIVAMYLAAGLAPPTVDEVQAKVPKNQALVPQLVSLAANLGQLVLIAPGMYLHADVERQVRATLSEKLAGSAGLTVSEIRELLQTTRKYAVPLCEHLDKAGFTKRVGDLRVLAQP